MEKQRGVAGPLLGMTVLFLLAALLTVAAFLTFVPPWRRGTALYVMVAVLCGAELTFFAYLAGWQLSRRTGRSLSGAARVQVYVLLVVWLIAALALAVFAAETGPERSAGSDRVLVGQGIATFLFFAFAYAVITRDLRLGETEAVVDARHERVTAQAGDLDVLFDLMRRLTEANPSEAEAIDRVSKRLRTLQTGLRAAWPEGSEREGPRHHVAEVEASISEQIRDLRGRAIEQPAPSADQLSDWLAETGRLIGRLRATIRDRERLLTV